MSHIVSIKTQVHDSAAVNAACQRLKLAAPTHGTVKLFNGEATGLVIKLPGWEYPAAIDTNTGTIHFDNYGGHWGDQKEMDKFLQAYAVEKARLEARRKGRTFTETQLQDGSIKLHIQEGQ